MNNREAVSKIINELRLNNKDNHRSRRFILKLLQDNSTALISQKLMDRTISKELNLFSTIECFEFEQIEVKRCPLIEFKMCQVLMKSKKPLPKLIFSRLGASIKNITSLDGNFRFTIVDKAQYQRNKKRKYKVKDEVYIYLGNDMHLYIPDEEIYSVDLEILTVKSEELDECSSCNKQKCKSKWDAEFICPDKLITTVFQMTLQELGINRQIVEDQNPNSIEGA